MGNLWNIDSGNQINIEISVKAYSLSDLLREIETEIE